MSLKSVFIVLFPIANFQLPGQKPARKQGLPRPSDKPSLTAPPQPSCSAGDPGVGLLPPTRIAAPPADRLSLPGARESSTRAVRPRLRQRLPKPAWLDLRLVPGRANP